RSSTRAGCRATVRTAPEGRRRARGPGRAGSSHVRGAAGVREGRGSAVSPRASRLNRRLEVIPRRVVEERGDALQPDLVGDEPLEGIGAAREERERGAE